MKSRILGSFLVLLASVGPAAAWDQHDALRRTALEALPALVGLSPVEVRALDVPVLGVNPATSFGFVGPGPGETQAPLDILVAYAMEPDWGMDQELKVSWQQRFMGGTTGLGSQGYFHMYYPSLTLHLPFPVTEMGAAPRRARQWFEMSQAAFARGNDYWGWRFAAWALHYVEDLTQPYHSTQTHRRFVRPGSPIQGTTNCTANFHLLYETWVARRLAEERSGAADYGFGAALRGAEALPPAPVDRLVKFVAKKSHKAFGAVATGSVAFFGPRFLSSEVVVPGPEDLDRLDPGAPLEGLLARTRDTFGLAGAALRAVVTQVIDGRGGEPALD